MSNVINIRKVDVGDANTLAYIQTESWKSAFNRILSKEDLEKYIDVNRAVELYNMLLSENIGNGFILTINENPHCMAYWDKTREAEMDGYSEISCIHSLCDNWGKGYGTAMINYILRDIKNKGFSKIMLWFFKENYRARKFYENHGFVLTEKTKVFNDAIEVMYCKYL